MRRRLTLMADEDPMSLVRAGDAAASEVYDRHADPVNSLAYRMNGRQDGSGRAGLPDVVGVRRITVARGVSTAVTQPTERPVLTVDLT